MGGEGGGRPGSMTVAGIATVALLKTMLREDRLKPDGTPDCCGDDPHRGEARRRPGAGRRLARPPVPRRQEPRLQSGPRPVLPVRPGAGRAAGRQAVLRGARLVPRGGPPTSSAATTPAPASGPAPGSARRTPEVGTAFALLFLAKGLSPVLINKLKYDDRRDDWQSHPADARNLTYHVSGLPKWPKLVTLAGPRSGKGRRRAGIWRGALQGPVTLMTGRVAPNLSDREVDFLRDYVDAGGLPVGRADLRRRAVRGRLPGPRQADVPRRGQRPRTPARRPPPFSAANTSSIPKPSNSTGRTSAAGRRSCTRRSI